MFEELMSCVPDCLGYRIWLVHGHEPGHARFHKNLDITLSKYDYYILIF